MGANGFKAVENKIEKLMEMLDPPKKDPIMVDLIEVYNDGGNDVTRIAIQPDTCETFLVVEEDPFDFQI